MMYIRFPLSLRQVEDLLHERGIDICKKSVRTWWNRFAPLFAAEIGEKWVSIYPDYIQCRWHLDEMFVRINCYIHYLRRAVDDEGADLEAYVTRKRDRGSAFRFFKERDETSWSPECDCNRPITLLPFSHEGGRQ